MDTRPNGTVEKLWKVRGRRCRTPHAPADSVVVQQPYDAEGNLTQVTRTRGVRFAGYGPLTATYSYDGAGRKFQDVTDGRTEIFVYDSAGNVRRHGVLPL